jgi:hypothetical protein
MLIEHYKKTPMALAPEEIARATNQYTDHTAIINAPAAQSIPNLYHFHNKPKPGLTTNIPSVMHYHSEPGGRVDLTFKGVKICPAQYHCLLPQYADCRPVRNIIPIWDENYEPIYPFLEKIVVGYSPSHTNTRIKGPFDKGFEFTTRVLKKLKIQYPGKFDFDVISGVPILECIQRKNRCNVVIDEVVTDSYHKCTLEGLALGKATICSMSQGVEDVLKRYAPSIPILNVWAKDLEEYLLLLIEEGPEHVEKIGVSSRQWMETYWRPEEIIKDYIAIYEEVLNG